MVLCLGALALAILSLSAERGFFEPQYRLTGRFDNVMGLLAGGPVWLAGKEVGRVESIRFAEVGSPLPLAVVLRIDRDIQDRIRADSVATIGTIGLLGDSYIEIGVGSGAAPILRDGQEIVTESPINLTSVVSRGTRAIDAFAELAENLNTVVVEFGDSGGGKGIATTVEAVNSIAVEIEQGDGLLHSVIYDSYGGGGVQSIEASLASLENILAEVREGEGILHTLIYDSPTEQDLVMEALEAGARLNNILAKIDRGEGTLGLFVNDPTLYEDLKILVGGAQRSTVVRSLIRMAVEDGKAP